MEKIASEFLQYLKAPVSKSYVEKLVLSHPDFPSLLSISDVFHRLGINHRVTRIEKEKVSDLEYPFLLPLDKGRGDILVVSNDNSLQKLKERLQEWSGVVLLAEPTATINDRVNNELYHKETNLRQYSTGIVLTLTCFFLFFIFNSTSWVNASLLTLSVSGLIVGYFLFAKELGISYAAVDAFCNTGKNTNCDRVLKSDVTLFGINFSDAVLAYFLFQTITLGAMAWLPQLAGTILFVFSVMSWVALPIVIFSLYYQQVIAKTWCRLCLVVDALLIAQTGVLGYAMYEGMVIIGLHGQLLIIMTLTGMMAFFGIMLVKVSMQRYEKLNQQAGLGDRIKHKAEVFMAMLARQRKIDATPFEVEMLLGNPAAPIKIIMVSNLFCNPCKLKHEVIDQLVTMYPDKVSVALRFVKSGRDVASVGYLLNYWYHNIYRRDNESRNTAKLMHHWFELWDFPKFVKKYPVQADEARIEKSEAQHYAWIDEMEIRQTPTFFVNGHELPKEYAIDDLMAMAPALAEMMGAPLKNELKMQHA
jgi:uncharacterized membrane protein/thiol-disulfide isomerase/thioredoxin